jgi:choline dehydrogenase-like flavoprotein
MTSPTAQRSDFSIDVLGRFVCNGLDEALRNTDTTLRPDARPFDIIVVGAGSFGPVVAQHLFAVDRAHRHRVLVLEAGPVAVAEHVQNYPMLGLGVPSATSIADLRGAGQATVAREQVWGLAWHSSVKFPGLAYCVGGRSAYFGGWSPRLLDSELPAAAWPAGVTADLKARYFDEAGRQIGVDETNDFIYGVLHDALRRRIHKGIKDGKVNAAVSLASLPDHPGVGRNGPPKREQLLDMLQMADDPKLSDQDLLNLLKLEAPLAVQSRTRPGFFPFNKFSALPLLIRASRAAWTESNNDDVKRRLMIVPNCHVKRLVRSGAQVTAVDTSQGTIPLPPGGAVVLALGTIETSRLALLSFEGLPGYGLIGRNLLAHLRSNLTVRFSRSALGLDPAELQASALFVKGRANLGGTPAHFHLQITAAGLGPMGADSEAELFKKIPDIDTFDRFRTASDTEIVVTIRGIGEMEPQNPASSVTLDPEPDEYGVRRAFVSIAPSARDNQLWDAMDKAADDLANVLTGGGYEVLTPSGFVAVPAGTKASTVLPFGNRRDGLGTTHHEAGAAWMGDDPGTSVTTAQGRFHSVANAYVAGPALFPTIGSPNPMLTGVALARRLAEHLSPPVTEPPPPPDGFTLLFNGWNTDGWRMAGKGDFIVVDSTLESAPGSDLGMSWCKKTPMPANFVLRLEWLRWRQDDNSGVFVRFPDPDSKGYDNTAYVAVHFGFEVQIDELARPDGLPLHRTGAIYDQPGQLFSQQPARPPGEWNDMEVRVEGQTYTVRLNGVQVSQFHNSDPNRGLPSTPQAPSYIGLQAHTGRVAFRNIRYKAL